jgi:thiol:disulfide interchange protein DsbD
VVFYANWCTACKALEHHVFTPEMIQTHLLDWELVRADVTAYGNASQALLKKFGLIGPPAILFFDKSGIELTNFRIVGEISAPNFIHHLTTLPKPEKSP